MGFSTISEARTIINSIMDVVDQQQNFKVVATPEINNAAAVTYQNQRYILYNPSFINQLDNTANDKWASISVLTHEIGHHLLGHTMDGTGSQLPKELASDEFSGLVLHRMGASLAQAQLAMQLISSPYASATHPGQRDRLAAISKGWNATAIVSNKEPDVAINNPNNNGRHNVPNDYPNRNYPTTKVQDRSYPRSESRRPPTNNYPNNRQPANAERIVYQVTFNRSNGARYYITSGNNIVQHAGNRLVVVARIGNSNNMRYPYVIYDDRVQLLVDRRGNIYSEGRSVGTITLA